MNLGERIMILGSSASGKSTLACQLEGITGVKAVHLDRLFWNPGWVQTLGDETERKVIDAANSESWIIDGNYSRTMEYRLERASSVIYIDFNRYICIFRALRRWVRNYGKTRWDLGDGCPEKIDAAFMSWIWNYPKRSREQILEQISKHCAGTNKEVYVLKTRKDVELFIKRAASQAREEQ